MKTDIITKVGVFGTRIAVFAIAFVIGLVSFNTTAYAQWGYTDYASNDWGYTDYSNSNWGYNDYSSNDWGYTDYNYSDWGYNDYNYNDWGYTDYNYSDWGYNDYNFNDWGYTDYNYTDYSFNDWGYTDYNYNDWGYTDYNYNDWGYTDYNYTDYAYTDYLVPDYGYTYTTPSGCTGSSCSNSYYRPSNNRGCSGSSCSGNNRGTNLGLGLNYSDDDTTVTNTTRVNNRIDNSVRITEDNDTTTTTNTCSNGDGNCNTTTNTHIVYGNGNDDDDDLEVQCRVSDTSIDEGDTVTFSVDVDGGRSPYDIEWDGDISGDDSSERVRFNRAGRYEVEVTVRDRDGNRASDTCAVVRVGDEDDDDDNRNINVITRTNRTNLGTPTGNLASLDSVFLSQVPYTGPEDVLKALGVLAFIAIWSTGVAIYFKRRRAQRAVTSRIADFKALNKTSATIR